MESKSIDDKLTDVQKGILGRGYELQHETARIIMYKKDRDRILYVKTTNTIAMEFYAGIKEK